MKKILVPTDFSLTAERALRFACKLALQSNSSILLFHSYTPMENAFIETGEARDELNKQTQSDLLKRLNRLAQKVTEQYPAIVTPLLGESPVIDTILNTAYDNAADLIIMGTQGASGLKKILIGTVAGRIIERTKIPVIFIPEKYELAELHEIVFTTINLNDDLHHIERAVEFARIFGASLKLVHLHTDIYNMEETERKEAAFTDFKQRIMQTMDYEKIQFRMIRMASATEGMEELHKKVPYDMLVMVRRKRSFLEKLFLESFTRNMAYTTTRPLLILPERSE